MTNKREVTYFLCLQNLEKYVPMTPIPPADVSIILKALFVFKTLSIIAPTINIPNMTITGATTYLAYMLSKYLFLFSFLLGINTSKEVLLNSIIVVNQYAREPRRIRRSFNAAGKNRGYRWDGAV